MTSASSRGLSDPRLRRKSVVQDSNRPTVQEASDFSVAPTTAPAGVEGVPTCVSPMTLPFRADVSDVAQLFATIVVDQGLGQTLKVPLDHLVQIVQRQADPMVGHAILRE